MGAAVPFNHFYIFTPSFFQRSLLEQEQQRLREREADLGSNCVRCMCVFMYTLLARERERNATLEKERVRLENEVITCAGLCSRNVNTRLVVGFLEG